MTRWTLQTPAGPVVAVPLTYLVACYPGHRGVHGYALQLPEPWTDIRLCARLNGLEWTLDHYATGLSARKIVRGDTLNEVARHLVADLPSFGGVAMCVLRSADKAEAERAAEGGGMTDAAPSGKGEKR